MDKLINTYRTLLQNTQTNFHRYMFDRINWSNRLVGIVGPRGVGKTTMMLQYIKERLDSSTTLYVTADDFYFSTQRLTDLADEFVNNGGKHLFVDEIHKHPEWSRELKLIYDYHPDLQVVFSGSSILDITRGATSDLSRRTVIYNMQGLSFREYLHLFHDVQLPLLSLDDILSNRIQLPDGFHPLPVFKQYLQQGYYPFASDSDYHLRLMGIINQTLSVDIPQYADMNASTARKLKHLLMIVAQSVPFKPNMTTIGQTLNVSRNNVADYLLYIEEAGLISQVRDATGGIRGLGKVNKVYLDNTNLIYALADAAADIGNMRETFFFNQMRVNHPAVSSQIADFDIGDFTFEVGGRSKGKRQIATAAHGYIVKDDIEYGYTNTIPLWTFGLNY